MSERIKVATVGILFALLGCGGPSGTPDDAKSSVVPASGKLLSAGGAPVANAWVVFNPKDVGGHEANAPTGPDGTFRLSTFGKEDGAIPGRYVVTVEPNPVAKGVRPNIPRQYSSAKDSPLTVEIPKAATADLEPLRLR
jgi:hypothetical protein